MTKIGDMISFGDGSKRFNFRAVAVILDKDERRVLIHRAIGEDFWALPGGRVELGESSTETLRREMREELGVDIEVDRLLWVSEEFYRHMDIEWHGIAFYFLVRLPRDCPIYEQETWSGIEEFVEDIVVPIHLRSESNRLDLIFQWFSTDELSDLELYPPFIREGLRDIPQSPQHIVRREYEDQ